MRPPFAISVFFHNKGFNYNLENVKNLFPDQLEIDEPPSIVYSLDKTKRNKILNYKETFMDINNHRISRTGKVEFYYHW